MTARLSVAVIGAGMGGLAAAAALCRAGVDVTVDDCTKWWGEDRHIVVYYVKPNRSEVYFVTSQPEPDFTVESWSAKGDMRTLRAAFGGFHPQVQHVLAACPDVHKWALADRDPLEKWHEGAAHLADQHLAAWQDRRRLGLQLQPMDHPAGSLSDCWQHQ